MTVTVPTQYQLYVSNAANSLGISPDIIAAQIDYESSWNPNAVSSAGAEGIAQFLPGTFSSYGSGSPFNVGDAFNAYTKYMQYLLTKYNGNVRDALAAYNAGPGNISAGYGYADHILSSAGQGTNASSGGIVNATPALNLNPLSWPGGIIKFFDNLSSGIFWMRVLMVVGGGIMLLYGIMQISGAGKAIVKSGKKAVSTGKKIGEVMAA